jgi:hypothetical protein
MTNPPTAGSWDNSRYLISATTRVQDETPCVRPPRACKAEFAAVLADFKRRSGKARVLKRDLSLSKPYELLKAEQVEAFKKERGWPKPEAREPNPLFTGVMEVFTLSDVYFSNNGRPALTAISSWCGGLCGLFQWRVLKKVSTGEWKEQPWVYCYTISQESGLSSPYAARGQSGVALH